MAMQIFSFDDEKTTARFLLIALSLSFAFVLVARQLSSHGQLMASDGVGYFVHLPSLVIDGDIDYRDDFSAFRQPTRNHWPIGTAIAWLPFYFVGHLVSLAGAGLGFDWVTDGTGFPEQLACCLGTIVYGAAAVSLSYRICCRWYPPRWALLGVLLFFAGSNLPYYLLAEPYMSHGVAVFWTSLLLFLGLDREPLTVKRSVLLGLVAGLSALTRPQDGLLVILPFLFHLSETKWSRLCGALITAGLVSSLVFAPQVLLWKRGLDQEKEQRRVTRTVEATPAVKEPISNREAKPSETRKTQDWAKKPKRKSRVIPGGRLGWTNPSIYYELVGRNHGLIVWHPLYLLGFFGVLLMLSRHRKIALVALAGILVHLYIVSVWAGQGQSFGSRMFVSCFCLFALGLTSLFHDLRPKGLRIPLISLAVIAGIWNVYLMLWFRQIIASGGRISLFKVFHNW